MSRVVAALESSGLIKRLRDPTSGRCSLVTITKAGHREIDAVRRDRTDVMAQRLLQLKRGTSARPGRRAARPRSAGGNGHARRGRARDRAHPPGQIARRKRRRIGVARTPRTPTLCERQLVMISQGEQKRVRALHQKKFRSETQRFLAQGRKVVAEALASSWKVEALYASEDAAEVVRPAALSRGLPVHVLAGHELDELGTFENGNELIAVVAATKPPPYRAPFADELVLALDGVRDPRNMGGLFRIADWFGVQQVVCSEDTIEVYNPKVVQSTMGSLFRVPVRYTALPTSSRASPRRGRASSLPTWMEHPSTRFG